MKPARIGLFILAIMAILLALTYFFPKNGIPITKDFTLSFAKFETLFTGLQKKELSNDILEQLKETEALIDTTQIASPDSLDSKTETKAIDTKQLKKNIYPIAYNQDKGKQKLFAFFRKAQKRNQLLRILHYADSQTEGDRITSFLRYQLQGKFGGNGPGLIPPVNFVTSFSINQENSDEWKRYSIMERNKYDFTHTKYGVLASFARYKSYNDSDTIVQTAWLKFNKSPIAFSNTKHFKKFRLFYGNNKKSVVLQLFAGSQLIDFTSLSPTDFGVYKATLPNDPNEITVKFIGADSPDIYAVAFDNNAGIAVDNIPVRGSSGTFFTKLDFSHLSKFYKNLNVGMVILEFGGNTLPYLKDSAACEQYGRYFSSQIYRFQRILPQIPIIVIGVADMSIKEKTTFVTYPLLEKLRDEMKKAAFTAGCGYWDMYEAMGGENSMPAWVSTNPPLAAPDYTHFTSKGANVIANMFYNALIQEYNNFVAQQKSKKKQKKK